MTALYLQVALALIAVIGLIYLTGFLMKNRQSKSSLMNILAYQSFGQRKGIAALKIGKEILLVGVTSTDIKLLKSYDETELELESVAVINDKLKQLKDLKKNFNEPE